MVTLGGQVWLERRVVVVGVRTGKGNQPARSHTERVDIPQVQAWLMNEDECPTEHGHSVLSRALRSADAAYAPLRPASALRAAT